MAASWTKQAMWELRVGSSELDLLLL
jgi:hypothetical protein